MEVKTGQINRLKQIAIGYGGVHLFTHLLLFGLCKEPGDKAVMIWHFK